MKQTGEEWGYIYIWMLFAVMLAGVMLAATGLIWQTEARREKEQELLFVGDQFRRAIESYYNTARTTAEGDGRYPESLEQLLKDERFPGIKRHLRKIYNDPLTNSRNWGLIRQENGGITGVYSLSTGVPIKRASFPIEYAAFENAENYQDWKFTLAGSVGEQGVQQINNQENIQDSNTGKPKSSGISPDQFLRDQPVPNVNIHQFSKNSADQPVEQ